MRKFILALSLCALVPMVTVAVARAEDDELVEEEYVDDEEEYEDEETGEESRAVGARMTCAEIQKEIDRLSALEEPEEADIEQLYRVKSNYRAKCVKSAVGRARGMAQVKNSRASRGPSPVEAGGATTCETPDENGCCPGESYTDLGDAGFNCCTANNEHCYPPMKSDAKQPEKKAKTEQKCDDGSKPDKNGCCTGEKYTDLGELGFNCCLGDGKTCFPPIK